MSAPTPESTARSRNGEAPAEYSRLEMLLAECARDAQTQRGELVRLRALLRDATGDFDRALAEAEPQTKIELAHQRDAAVIRALDAEAARTEALFRVDELMGRLADAPGDSMAGRRRSADVVPHTPDARTSAEALERDSARLAESARHLEGQLSETRAELERAQARATSAENELLALRTHVQAVEGDLGATADKHTHADGMADALRDTKRVLSELARAVQRASRGLARRDAPAEVAQGGGGTSPKLD